MLPFSRSGIRNLTTSLKLFDKILIANRGEISIRVMKTAQAMGIKCVAVCSEADKSSQHVLLADESVVIGPPASSKSYLSIENIVNAMKQTGAQAVHPGYGFLSENYKFAAAVEKSDLVFIGPPSSAIKSMGSKSESKKIMEKAGVPCIPGYHGEDQNPQVLALKAQEIGYPIMIKAVLGGGGKGMRIAKTSSEFSEMLESAKRESLKSFGDDRVLLEKYIERSRHIEVQVFADKQGKCVYLFERDCSIQRRNQKVIEEAPASDLDAEVRRRLGQTAVAAAKAVNYVGPGTVEFIYDCSDGAFYFMEMNTRLQVEHTVTEMITVQDLVEWQIKVAAGFPLPLKQDDLRIDGHSIEARIYAEKPDDNFLPDTGKLLYYKYPPNSPDLRVETGVKADDEISVYYDPMIAKVVVKGRNRDEAIKRLDKALSELHIAGVATNTEFLRRILSIEDFNFQNIDTVFIKKHEESLLKEEVIIPQPAKILAALASLCRQYLLENKLSFFRLSGSSKMHFKWREGEVWLQIDSNHQISATVDSESFSVEIIKNTNDQLWARINNQIYQASFFFDDSINVAHLWIKSTGHFQFHILKEEGTGSSEEKIAGTGQIYASMPCKVSQVLIKAGDTVAVGTPLVITEAMKMEQIIKADIDGKIDRVYCHEGQVVPKEFLLLSIQSNSVANQ